MPLRHARRLHFIALLSAAAALLAAPDPRIRLCIAALLIVDAFVLWPIIRRAIGQSLLRGGRELLSAPPGADRHSQVADPASADRPADRR